MKEESLFLQLKKDCTYDDKTRNYTFELSNGKQLSTKRVIYIADPLYKIIFRILFIGNDGEKRLKDLLNAFLFPNENENVSSRGVKSTRRIRFFCGLSAAILAATIVPMLLPINRISSYPERSTLDSISSDCLDADDTAAEIQWPSNATTVSAGSYDRIYKYRDGRGYGFAFWVEGGNSAWSELNQWDKDSIIMEIMQQIPLPKVDG